MTQDSFPRGPEAATMDHVLFISPLHFGPADAGGVESCTVATQNRRIDPMMFKQQDSLAQDQWVVVGVLVTSGMVDNVDKATAKQQSSTFVLSPSSALMSSYSGVFWLVGFLVFSCDGLIMFSGACNSSSQWSVVIPQ